MIDLDMSLRMHSWKWRDRGRIGRASLMMHYPGSMRTTVDLPPAVHHRVRELAASRHQSMSRVIADLTMTGLAGLQVEVEYTRDPRSGLPVLSLGRTVDAGDVADALDDE